jgi:tight adherence protein C
MLGIDLSSADSILQSVAGSGNWQFLMFGAVFFATIGAAMAFRPRRSMLDRIEGEGATRAVLGPRVSLRHDEPDTRLHQALRAFENYFATDEDKRSANRLRMIRAGYAGNTAIRYYYGTRVLLALTLPIVFLALVPALFPTMTLRTMLLVAAGLCVAGLYLPYRWIESKIEARRLAIQNGFPDALDMLVVCVEAGLSLDAAFARVAEQIGRPHPVIGSELRQVGLELRAGKTREQALTNFATRSGVEDIGNVTAVLIQSDALGSDLAEALRVQADEMRAKRTLRAEEIAHTLPVKLAFPLVTCILPALFAVVVGPALIAIFKNLIPALTGK